MMRRGQRRGHARRGATATGEEAAHPEAEADAEPLPAAGAVEPGPRVGEGAVGVRPVVVLPAGDVRLRAGGGGVS